MKKHVYIFFNIIVIFTSSVMAQKTLKFNREESEFIRLTRNFEQDLNKRLIEPYFCDVSDTILVVTENKLENTQFKFFSTVSGKFLGSYGKKGEGPGEISYLPTMIHQDFIKNEGLIFLDWGKKRISKIRVESMLERVDFIPQQYYVLHSDLIFAQRVMYLNASTVVGFGGVRQGRLYVSNIRTDETTFTEFIPDPGFTVSERNIGYAYFGYFSISSANKRIVTTSRYFNQLEIYDYNLNLLSVIRNENEFEIQIDTKGLVNENSRVYYNDIDVSDNYIYALYVNVNVNETLNEMLNDDEVEESEIHVFDWDGNFLMRYILEGYYESFTIDERNNRFYAVNPYDISKNIYSFDIK